MANQSWASITGDGLDGFRSAANPAGPWAYVWGTIVTSLIAMALALPLGVGVAIYLSEIATGWVRKAVSFLIELLAAIPSVVYGFWGVVVLAPWLNDGFVLIGGTGANNGKGVLACGIIIAIMILPYIAAISFDVIRAVPMAQRQGAHALGATRWQAIKGVVIPFARPGIIGGAFIALGRALGETMAATMVIGNSAEISLSPFAKGDTIASVIANQYSAAFGLRLSALSHLALILLGVNLVVNAAARALLRSTTRPGRAASGSAAWRTVGGAISTFGFLLLPAGVIHATLQVALGDPEYFFPASATGAEVEGGSVQNYALHILAWVAILYGLSRFIGWGVPKLFSSAVVMARVINRAMTARPDRDHAVSGRAVILHPRLPVRQRDFLR